MTTNSKSPVEELFQEFPRGIALLELIDSKDTSTWRLLKMNAVASAIVPSSIEKFLSGERLGLGRLIDLPQIYQEILSAGRARTLGFIEPRSVNFASSESRSRGIGLEARVIGQDAPSKRLRGSYMVSAFHAGPRRVGILFEDADAYLAGRSARIDADRQLTRTCEFLGAVLWKAEPHTLRFTYISPHAQSVLGYWPERWTGEINFWRKRLYPDDRERVTAVCQEIARDGKKRDFEFRMIGSLNQIVWFHAAAELAEIPGRKPELSGVMNDITAVKNAEERVRALSSRLMRVQDDERRHVSRELHDSLGQYLTSMKINFDILKRESGALDEQHRGLLVDNAETLERCVKEVRTVSYLLHPPLLDELGLVAALRWYAGGFADRTGLAVNLDIPPRFSRLPAEMELGLFRVVQESLTNIQRHSHSDVAWIAVSEQANRAAVRIVDCGVGIPAETVERIQEGKSIEGVGLRGMYERVRELGGQIEIQSSNAGTAVSATLPLKRVEAQHAGEEPRTRTAGKPFRRVDTSDVQIEAGPRKNQAGDDIIPDRRIRPNTARGHRRAFRRPT
jgi:signal transduction histidine kinase